MLTNVQTQRRFAVSVAGQIEDEAVPAMKKRLESVGTTVVENYDVYLPLGKLSGAVNFRVRTDADPKDLEAAVSGFENVTGVRTEDIDAVQKPDPWPP